MAQVATPEVVAPAAAVEASDEGGAAPVSPPTSLPVAWQKAGLTERPRDTHSAPRPEEDASSQTLTEAAPPPVLPSVSSEDLGQAERTV